MWAACRRAKPFTRFFHPGGCDGKPNPVGSEKVVRIGAPSPSTHQAQGVGLAPTEKESSRSIFIGPSLDRQGHLSFSQPPYWQIGPMKFSYRKRESELAIIFDRLFAYFTIAENILFRARVFIRPSRKITSSPVLFIAKGSDSRRTCIKGIDHWVKNWVRGDAQCIIKCLVYLCYICGKWNSLELWINNFVTFIHNAGAFQNTPTAHFFLSFPQILQKSVFESSILSPSCRIFFMIFSNYHIET